MLKRLLTYGQKQYGLLTLLKGLVDTRKLPRIPTPLISQSLFMMFLARLGSLNALEQTVASRAWRQRLGGKPPSADTLGRVAGLLDSADLRAIHGKFYAQLKRNKALSAPSHGLIALLIDGHETTSSYRRCCPGCLQRTIRTTHGNRTQYYHRYVFASLVGEGFHLFLDSEPLAAGEDEVAAATRLTARVHQRYPRAYDVVVADSLYARADFFRSILALGKEVLTVLKQEARDLMADARGLFATMKPIRSESGSRTFECWDAAGFTSWSSLNSPVRVVKSLETERVRRQLDGKLEEKTSEWVWVTTLSRPHASTATVVQLGHSRWRIENEGFNEIANHWKMDHVYRHEPAAMLALSLLGMLAYNLLHVFYRRGLKPAWRAHRTLQHLAALITAQIYTGLPKSHAAT